MEKQKPTELELMPVAEPETWLPVRGFESAYSVSSHGRVRSEQRTRIGKGGKPVAVNERIISQSPTGYGHMHVTLWSGGKQHNFWVHALVLDAHVCIRPLGMQACHNDGNPANNHVSNLRWGTAKSNQQDRVAHGTSSRGASNGAARLTESQVREIRNDVRNLAEIASTYGVSQTAIRLVKSRKRWSHIGEGT